MGKSGFDGAVPCSQKKGKKKFYTKYQEPSDIVYSGKYKTMPTMGGCTKHEGSFVYGGMTYV